MRFLDWSNKLKGVAGSGYTNVEVGPSKPGAPRPHKKLKRKKRLPDVALWGRSRCTLDNYGNVKYPQRVSQAVAHLSVHPHVVIQVSNFDDEDYEIDAINDLANRAAAWQGDPPTLAVLIKVRKTGFASVQPRFDIYYLPEGTYMDDALAGDKGARHVVYNHNGPDVL